MSTWNLKYVLKTDAGAPLAGSSSLTVKVMRDADNYFLDFDDGLFYETVSGSLTATMTEIDATQVPGAYIKEITTTDWDNGAYTAFIDHAADPVIHGATQELLIGGMENVTGTPGAGALAITYTVTNSANDAAIPNVSVWVTTDAAGLQVVASGTTDDAGEVDFNLDPSVTYYFWKQMNGWDDDQNPDTESFGVGDLAGAGTMTAVTAGAGTQTWSTTRTALAKLGLLMNDVDENIFSPTLKLSMLNDAQDRLVNTYPHHLLSGLVFEDEDLSLSLTDGSLETSSLTHTLFDGWHSIERMKLSDTELPVDLISDEEYIQALEKSHSFDSQDPVYRIEGAKIIVLPFDTTTATTIDLKYLKAPRAFSLAQSPANDGTCQFSDKVLKIIIGLACEDYQERSPAAQRAYLNANERIQEEREKKRRTDSHKRKTNHFGDIPEIGNSTGFGVRMQFS